MKFSQILLEKISHYLRDRNESVSVAEGVTSGLIQAAFSQMSFAEEFFEGGVTAFTTDQKLRLLDIDSQQAEVSNCVSRSVTEAMALNVANLFSTQWSVATTGYCTPLPISANEIYAYYAIVYKGKVLVSNRIAIDQHTKAVDATKHFSECALKALQIELKRPASSLLYTHSHLTDSAEYR